MSKNSFLAVVLRGDHDLNLTKLAKQEEVSGEITLASEDEVKEILGAPVGFIGPINCGLKVLIDHEAFVSNNLVCGGNRADIHMKGFNSKRDLSSTDYRVTDIRNVSPGDKAATGEGELKFFKGIEVGHIFQLGTKYSEAMKATVLDESGTETPAIMGCYGMGVTRLVAAAIEQHHDHEGIVWPEKIAPFFVHLLPLNMHKSELVREIAEHCYDQLASRGIEVLIDDREERPGVKFAEADLIGIPHRLVVGEKGLQDNLIEYLERSNKEVVKLSPEEAIERIVGRHNSLTAGI
jgi:prolyl-tRNA synthetase